MSWIVFLKTGKRLPGSFTVILATISSADECTDNIIKFIIAHAPGAQGLVIIVLYLELSFTFKPFFFF